MFIVNIAIANLVTIVGCYPLAIASSVSGRWVGGTVLCDVTGYATGVSSMVSIVSLFAFALDIHGLVSINHNNTNALVEVIHTTKSRVLKVLISVWLYSSLCILPPLIGWSDIKELPAGLNCAPDWSTSSLTSLSYLVFLVINAFVWPVVGMFYLLYKVHKMLKSSQSSAINATLMVRHLKYRRLIRVVGAALIANCIVWTPYMIYSFVMTIRGDDNSSSAVKIIPAYIAKLSCMVNPIVYMIFDTR